MVSGEIYWGMRHILNRHNLQHRPAPVGVGFKPIPTDEFQFGDYSDDVAAS